ncbi:MAG: glycosyltransferase family 4 protein [Nitrospiraceae bacterium]|nr:glycosyltransferase family 4 protein [Nitrospiraceae bacterium]
MGRLLKSQGRPFGVEVIGDPWEFFVPGSVSHPLRPFMRVWFYRQLARLCVRANGVAYVTREALQRRYPARPGAMVASYSDVELPDSAYRDEARVPSRTNEPIRLVSVGTLAQLYKAQDVLIAAVSDCVAQGMNLQLVLVGDGQFRAQLEAQARTLGMGARVRFAGELPSGEAVRDELDRSDVFVLPSRSEGLPRALIEAMARGLPCIGSTVGGIPELLHPDDLVAPNDARALSRMIARCIEEPGRLVRMGERNLLRAKEYHETVLRKARVTFYEWIRGETERARTVTHTRGRTVSPSVQDRSSVAEEPLR